MDTLDRSTLEELAGHEGWPAVSLYLPAHRAGNETQQDPIRLKNLIRQAEELLLEQGVRSPDAASLLEPARTVQADGSFWREGFEGVALFISKEGIRAFRTSRPLPEQMRVASRFLVRPLINALDPDIHFIVLALSKKQVRVLEGNASEIHELEPEGIPQGLAEALKYDDYEKQVQFHSGTPASGRGRRSAIFHGHGGTADSAKEDLLRYFRQVDRGLKDLLGERSVPLMLAGVDYLLPIYREASTYPELFSETITGNPDEARPAEIHAEAMALLKPRLEANLTTALDSFAEKRAGEHASADLREIVPAAIEGRIDTLVVAETGGAWGLYDTDTGAVTLRSEPQNGDVDLLDRAAAETLLNGGTVHVISAEGIRDATGGVEAAAIMRY